MSLARGHVHTMRFRLIVSAISGLVAVLLMAAPSSAATRAATATCTASVNPVYHVNHVLVGGLRGHVHANDLVEVDFRGGWGNSNCEWSLTSYQAADSSFALAQQARLAFTSASGRGKHYLSIQVPNCFFQVDFANGPSIANLSDTNRYGPRLIDADTGGSASCVTVAAVAPDCSLATGANISSSFTFTNPATTSTTVAVTRTVLGSVPTTLLAVTVLPGATTFTFPAVEDATQSFSFVGRGLNVTMPATTVDCLKPLATMTPACDQNTGIATAIISVVNPDAADENVQVSGGGQTVTLAVKANSAPATMTVPVVNPASPPTYVVTDASETPVFSQALTVAPFTCGSPT